MTTGNSHSNFDKGQPVPPTALDGLRVLDMSSLYAGPLIATNLGDFGADVIKVEHSRGDDARRWGKSKGEIPLWWKVISRNKRLISLDLHEAGDRDIFKEICAEADVLIENFRPGRMEAWGLGTVDLHAFNPRLVIVKVTGFGQTGPYSNRPGFGTLAEAWSGFAYITGQSDGPPTLPPFGLADGVAALAGTYAVMMALYWRDALGGGAGQEIDLSLYEPLFNILGPQMVEYDQLGVIQQRQGNMSPRTAPRNCYRTRDDNWVAISAGTQQIANRVFAAISQPCLSEDPRFLDSRARVDHALEIDEIVAAWIGDHDLSEVLKSFNDVEAPIAPVFNSKQIAEDEHYLERQSIIRVEDPDLGQILMQNVVPKMTLTPGKIRFPGHVEVDADRQDILANGWAKRGHLSET